MLYAQKKSTTATNSHALRKFYLRDKIRFTVYSICKKYAIHSLKI